MALLISFICATFSGAANNTIRTCHSRQYVDVINAMLLDFVWVATARKQCATRVLFLHEMVLEWLADLQKFAGWVRTWTFLHYKRLILHVLVQQRFNQNFRTMYFSGPIARSNVVAFA